MRRLITTWLLITTLPAAVLFATAAAMKPLQPSPSTLYTRWDRANHVLCYSTTPEFSNISCVYVPPDGLDVQLNLPKPGPGDSNHT